LKPFSIKVRSTVSLTVISLARWKILMKKLPIFLDEEKYLHPKLITFYTQAVQCTQPLLSLRTRQSNFYFSYNMVTQIKHPRSPINHPWRPINLPLSFCRRQSTLTIIDFIFWGYQLGADIFPRTSWLVSFHVRTMRQQEKQRKSMIILDSSILFFPLRCSNSAYLLLSIYFISLSIIMVHFPLQRYTFHYQLSIRFAISVGWYLPELCSLSYRCIPYAPKIVKS